ncbi:hypothetical protein ASPZODRAFT_131664 [Penicilliopsis zonata CBS 506.65]|uniref:N-acetyltransferase domain-containing protein n=1 Tax=Penicilliopsis zonata CBS 506.65 TaxID=1073090 RepID=A0A1L9SLU3_9EURO|nr:hypothetical protein ASPZODRAFT_131664 [Penicilliopsis zonata CBS 506.65]OJJ48014.1 hypothetical protein ASPZODRAFT_131664 [Penicilliopsis zonata CBS 506.65]
MKANILFRIATSHDALRIQELIESAFRAQDTRPNWTDGLDLTSHFTLGIDEVLSTINAPDTATLIGFNEDETLVSSVSVSRKTDSTARLFWLAVHQNYQRGGLGRQTLAYAETYSRQTWAVDMMGLNALSTRVELRRWYVRHGYRETGETSPFPQEQVRALHLPPELCFNEFNKNLS